MLVRICPASGPPPMASNARVAAVAMTAADNCCMNTGDVELQILHRAERAEHVLLGLRPHDVHQADAVGQADLVEHLAQIGRCRRVDQRGMPLASHRLDHSERGERIDEA